MPKLKLSTKAKTIQSLSKILKTAKILPLIRFTVQDYNKNSSKIINTIQAKFQKNIIVRSSSAREDNQNESNAGAFESEININIKDKKSIKNAIEKVINSFGKNFNQNDEVFIQQMLSRVTMSGVIFSCDMNTLSPYYIINYDKSGSTNSVTSGNTNNLKSFVCFKEYKKVRDKNLKKIIDTTKECEKIFNNEFLDIEFAFSNNQLYILQVRALVTHNKENLSKINLSINLKKLKKKIQKLNSYHPNLLGNKTIFSVMTDWNPAEIIGLRPKSLALSLYKELITDETWAYQRDNYGYRNLRSHPLLVSFLGVPYIDVRISFNSFIPKDLENKIAKKLVNYYLNRLSSNINNHDKVEFKIIYSCFYFGIEKKLLKLLDYDFNKNELKTIKKSLLNLTNNIINQKSGLYKKDLDKAKILNTKFDDIVNSDLPLIDKIYWLIKDVKRYGTLPFAGVARAGFIAIQILNSFVEEKIISQDQYNKYLNTLNTVSKKLTRDNSLLSKKEFLKIYGHLRPGTYDILSPRYDEFYEIYFNKNKKKFESNYGSFTFTNIQKNKINKLIDKNNLNTNFNDLIRFLKEAIEGREYVKFLFTKHLSQILKYIDKLGKKIKIDQSQLAFLDIQKILNLYSSLDFRNLKDILKDDIEKNKELYEHTKAIKLPNTIVNEWDIYSFFLGEAEPNFITLNKIKSEVITEENLFKQDIKGKIVCIKSADPGYDYLFSKKIGGLITCYGGANSHMAIRCSELGIPAIIGCGENFFSKYCSASNLEIDAANKSVIILK
jgi:phosphoenolpyruvate synthase/pyruvate phosphate dikinase